MTFVVCFTAIVTEEWQGVALHDVFGVRFHELLGAVPQRGNGLDVFVQTEDEAVLLLVFLHESERVIMDVAEQLNARFDSPVIFKLVHQRVTEEKSGLKPAHVSIADGVTIDDLSPTHIFSHGSGLSFINP